MIEDKATEKWKERMKKLGLIVNMEAAQSQSKLGSKPKVQAKDSKVSKKQGQK